MKDNKTLGDQIKKLRLSRKENQEQFGKLFNPPATKGVVSKWENGKSIPSLERLKLISKLSGKDMNVLLYGSLKGAVNQAAEYIKKIQFEYFDKWGNPIKGKPVKSDFKISVAFDVLPFILHDSYIKFPSSLKHHQDKEFSELEQKEYDQYLWDNFIKGLDYCSKETYQKAKIMGVEPYQEEIIFRLFQETAKNHFDEIDRTNDGAINLVSNGLDDIGTHLNALRYTSYKNKTRQELPNKIDDELYKKLFDLIDRWSDEVYTLKDQYGNGDY